MTVRMICDAEGKCDLHENGTDAETKCAGKCDWRDCHEPMTVQVIFDDPTLLQKGTWEDSSPSDDGGANVCLDHFRLLAMNTVKVADV